MSHQVRPGIIVRWAPGDVVAYHPAQGRTQRGATISAATAGMPLVDALIALSRRTGFVRALRLPNVAKPDIEILVRNQLGNLFPVPPKELAFDTQITDDITAEGRLVLVGACRADNLRDIESEAAEANLRYRAIIPAGFGAVAVARHANVPEAAVIEEDDGALSIDIVMGGSLRYSRSSAVLEDAESEVLRTFAAANLPCRPTLATNSSKLPAEHHTSMSTLAGLSEIDLARPPLHLELLEERAKRESGAHRARIRLALLFLAASLVLGTFVVMDRMDKQAKVNAVLAESKDKIDKLDTRAKGIENLVGSLRPSADLIKRGFSPAQRSSDVITILANDAPSGVWLTGLSMERGKPLSIRGTALTAQQVAAYVATLASDPRFRDIKLPSSTNAVVENKQVVQFSLTAFAVGNVPLILPPKPAPKIAATVTATGATS